MFRLFRVIIRPSSELIQNYLIPSALWDPLALTIAGAIVLWVHLCYYSVYGYLCYYVTMLQVYKPIKYLLIGKFLCTGQASRFNVTLRNQQHSRFRRELYSVVTVLLVSFQWPRAVVTVGVG